MSYTSCTICWPTLCTRAHTPTGKQLHRHTKLLPLRLTSTLCSIHQMRARAVCLFYVTRAFTHARTNTHARTYAAVCMRARSRVHNVGAAAHHARAHTCTYTHTRAHTPPCACHDATHLSLGIVFTLLLTKSSKLVVINLQSPYKTTFLCSSYNVKTTIS